MNFRGAIRLFRVWGIDVFLHWSWLIVAAWQIQRRRNLYDSLLWAVLQYLTLFAIVLMHEFGHALACRSVGGKANQIILWPLGGIAFVQPPPRPGAHLWSIAAGPLVNLALIPVTVGLYLLPQMAGISLSPATMRYLEVVAIMNALLLGFNMLPIYPLDGGQILRSILWYFLGPVRSLQAASIIGIVGIVTGVTLIATRWGGNVWLYVIAAYAAMHCFVGLKHAKFLGHQQNREQTRRPQLRCPVCGQAPLMGAYWKCTCGEAFDTFATMGTCPRCGIQHYVTACPDCRTASPLAGWYGAAGHFPVIFNNPAAFNSGETPPQGRPTL